MHVPEASQVSWLVCTLAAQESALPHAVPEASTPQAPSPLQVPVVQADDAHSLSGSLFARTLVHVPSAVPVFAAEQAWQLPVHALPQHTPSTQCPLPHCTSAEHAPPRGKVCTQRPPEQNAPALQSANVRQLVLHVVPPHA